MKDYTYLLENSYKDKSLSSIFGTPNQLTILSNQLSIRAINGYYRLIQTKLNRYIDTEHDFEIFYQATPQEIFETKQIGKKSFNEIITEYTKAVGL